MAPIMYIRSGLQTTLNMICKTYQSYQESKTLWYNKIRATYVYYSRTNGPQCHFLWRADAVAQVKGCHRWVVQAQAQAQVQAHAQHRWVVQAQLGTKGHTLTVTL